VESSQNCTDMGTKLSVVAKFENDVEGIMGVQGSFSVGACQRFSASRLKS